jgi:hypothetical protein
MKNSAYLYIASTFLLGYSLAFATPETPEILISAKEITETTTEQFQDGQIAIDVNGDGLNDSVINYFYSRIGPPGTCGEDANNCTPTTNSTITFDIDLPDRKTNISFSCNAIGIYLKKSNQHRDIFCGPKIRLHWTGQEYLEY